MMASVTTTQNWKKNSIPKFTKVITHNMFTIHVYHTCIQNYCRQSNMSVFTPDSVLAVFPFSRMSGWLQLNKRTALAFKPQSQQSQWPTNWLSLNISFCHSNLFHARSSNILASPQFVFLKSQFCFAKKNL
jgi:hypothetical protein